MKKGKRILWTIVLTILFGLVYFYLTLPAINLREPAFYWFFIIMAAVYTGLSLLFSGGLQEMGGDTPDAMRVIRLIKSKAKVPAICCLILVGIFIVGSIISAPILRARSFAQVLEVQHSDFATDVREISFDQIPMLDAVSAARLGNRTLGELADVVSQFEVAEAYTQINFQDRPVRVAPLVYGDLIKWFNNTRQGLPAYIRIDMVTQQAEVVRFAPGNYMRYSPSEFFFRNIDRHLRFSYPTFMFGDPVFEIDDEGTPYWIAPRLTRQVGLFGGTDVDGAVLVNAITGASQFYTTQQIPTWVSRVFSADLLLEQYNWHGAYSNGFINSILGQRGVTRATRGYNYIAFDGDVYLYTGITSVGGDASIIGFVLVNQRTKQATLYSVAGAEEYAAMASAEGLVQDLRYVATFPILLNIADRPTYFVALKDNMDIVRQYAMVDVEFSQIAVNAPTVQETERLFREELLRQGLTHAEAILGAYDSGTIEEIRVAVIDGNSHYFIRLQGDAFFYVIVAAENPHVVILDEGDLVDIYRTQVQVEGNLIPAYRIDQQ
ncbi:MAG: CvpA family protein [Oscillospiraceae bacterium]|nr:CvpA family protein [Oscillospiraceae bacterium]